MKLLLVNGPPRSGKDTFGQFVRDQYVYTVLAKFADPVKSMAHRAYGLSVPVDHFDNDQKDVPCEEFYGRTPREVYIALSEALMKPLHGVSIFGRMLRERLEGANLDPRTLIVVTDSGFHEEAEELLELFPPEDMAIVHMRRKGCSFDGDSRGWVDLGHHGIVAPIPVTNNGMLEHLRFTARRISHDLIMGAL